MKNDKTNSPKIAIKIVDYGSEDYLQNISLRNKILRNPLGLELTKEDIEKDRKYIHISAFNAEDKVVGTAILIYLGKQYQLRQLAVEEKYSGKGLGTKILQFCEEYAKRVQIGAIFCYARQTAVDFYIHNNYKIEGTFFLEHTIPHIKMIKNLDVKSIY